MNTLDFMTMPTPATLPTLPTWRERVHVEGSVPGSTSVDRIHADHNSIAASAGLSDYAVTLGAAKQANAAARKASTPAAPPRGEPR